jgi:uncharacterized protein YecT (DUF1311 family)
LVTLAIALSAASAGAQTLDCKNAMTQSDMNMCAGQDAKKADAALNTTYQLVMKRLSVPAKARLRDAQRAWLAFRDKECLFESSGADGGSVSPMIHLNCFAAVTSERTKALAAFRTCEEGDLSCPR